MANSFDDFIIPPVDQDAYFNDSLFTQYLGTEPGSKQIRAFIPGAYTDSANGIEYIYQSILDAFCIDNAVGTQLDLIGYLVGLPRMTTSETGQNTFFEFDVSVLHGFDYANFRDGNSDESTLVSDDQYRLFLKVKIAANVWDGTRVGLKKILQIATDADKVEIENIDYTYDMNSPFYLDSDDEDQGFDNGYFDVALDPYAPFVLDTDDDSEGFDNGNFDIGVGYAKPAVFKITFVGNIEQKDIDALSLLDIIPTPQGVRLDSISIGT